MKAQFESISPVKTRLSVELSEEEVAKEEDTTYRDLRRTAAVPGFRRGKAPISMLKRLYHDRVRSETLDRLLKTTYQEAIEKEKIVPVSKADIQLHSDPAQGGLSYTAVVEIRPQITPREYKDLRLTKEKVEVEEGEVDASIESLRQGRATFEPAPEDHEVEDGDMVVVDYEGTIDGEPIEGGAAEDQSLVLGTDGLLPGFKEGLVGMAAGEERAIDVEYPEDYEPEPMAGKVARFRVRVREVKIRRLPDLDDDFANEVAGAGSIEELRDRVREAARAEKTASAEQRFRDRLIDTLLEANPFEVPESIVREQTSLSVERMRRDLEQRGHDPSSMGFDKPEIQEAHQRGAERAVRWAFLFGAIADGEGIEVSDQDVEQRIQAIVEADGRPAAVIRSFFQEEGRLDSLKNTLLERKVIDHVVSAATVEEVNPEVVEQGED